ncbi:MAG: GH25 family lysozyme [Clostridia bacterium]
MKEKLIDVSTWNGNIDWNKVYKSGVKYAMIRSSFGVENPNQIDNKFVRNITNAVRAGVKCGVYHYSYAQSAFEAKREAEFCLKTIKGYKIDLPVAFDIEDSSQTGLGRRVCTDMVIAFCDTIKSAGYKPILYCNPNWLQNYLYKDELLKKYDIWLANWGVSSPSYDCAIWQYSENGSVSGISGSVDMNWIFKDYTNSSNNNNKSSAVKVINKTSYLRSHPWVDDKGGSSRKLATLTVGTEVDYISDDGCGWSKVHGNNTTGYIQNTRISKTGISAYRYVDIKIPLYSNISDKKPVTYLTSNDKYYYICSIESGKNAGWSIINANGKDYYIKTENITYGSKRMK